VIRHGRRGTKILNIVVLRREGGPMRIEARRFHRSEDSDVDILRTNRRVSGFRVVSKRIHLPSLSASYESFVVRFRIGGHGSSGFLDCRVTIVHESNLPPLGDPPPPPPPPPPGGNQPGAAGRGRLPSYTVRCHPDPLELRHGTKASTLFLLRDLHPNRPPPAIAVTFNAPPASTTIFSLLSRLPGATRTRTPLSHHGVLADSFRVHALANPIESYTLTLRFQRAGEGVLERPCAVRIRHDQGSGQPNFSLGSGPRSATGFYTNGQGPCPFATQFNTGLQITSTGDGRIEIFQPSTGDRVAGTVTPDGHATLSNQSESYDIQFNADRTVATGRYTYTRNGCTMTYDVRIEVH
jgi:hypothetical protein